ncbi:MAG TPA: cellulase family glycosylhydrolase [Thermoleophilaceae bacterium]|nr:cellulase family glycosylhydrolase [Thermoleophilaceae bacterium]
MTRAVPTSRTVRAALCAAVLALLALAPQAMAARDLETSIMDDQLLLGASQEEIDGAMFGFRALGVDRLRVSAFWSSHAPRSESTRKPSFDAANGFDPAYDWSRLDPVVLAASRAGLRVMISISTPAPIWATAAPRRRNPVLRPNPDEFAAFARAVAGRYSAVADRFALLNEPNQGAWLQPQSDRRGLVSPHLYRRLVQAAYPAIKAVAPGAVAVVGELASSGRSDRGTTRPVRPLEFLRAMSCRSRRFRAVRTGRCRGFQPIPADAIGHHPYSLFRSPAARSPNRDDAAIGDGRRLVRTLDRLTRSRALRPGSGTRLDVFYTEFGYQTDPPDPFAGISLSRQNRWLQDAARVAWSTPRVRELNQFRLTDGEIRGGRGSRDFSEFQSGLIFAGGRAKPALRTFPHPFSASTSRPRRGQRVRLWGQVRRGEQHLVALERRIGRGRFRRIARFRTDERGIFQRSVPRRRASYRFFYRTGEISGRSAVIAIRPR